MKRRYEKPSVKVEQYESNVSVATSWCNTATTLTCLIGNQSHKVFSTGQDDCGNDSTLKYVYIDTDVYLNGSYMGHIKGYYYIWYDGDVSDYFNGEDNLYSAYLKQSSYDTGYHIAEAGIVYGAVTSG